MKRQSISLGKLTNSVAQSCIEAMWLEQVRLNKEKHMIGRKDDAGKLRYSLLPCKQIADVVKVLEFGAKEYSEDNWKSVSRPIPRYTDACLRHVMAMVGGEWLDTASHLPHAAHAVCCLLFIMWHKAKEVM